MSPLCLASTQPGKADRCCHCLHWCRHHHQRGIRTGEKHVRPKDRIEFAIGKLSQARDTLRYTCRSERSAYVHEDIGDCKGADGGLVEQTCQDHEDKKREQLIAGGLAHHPEYGFPGSPPQVRVERSRLRPAGCFGYFAHPPIA